MQAPKQPIRRDPFQAGSRRQGWEPGPWGCWRAASLRTACRTSRACPPLCSRPSSLGRMESGTLSPSRKVIDIHHLPKHIPEKDIILRNVRRGGTYRQTLRGTEAPWLRGAGGGGAVFHQQNRVVTQRTWPHARPTGFPSCFPTTSSF